MRARLIILLMVMAGLGVVATATATASRSQPAPLAVKSASLTQSGRQLVWTVALPTPFSPAALARAGRSLCLQIEQGRDARVTGQLC
ncbi:MAG: hypothetical protein WAL63_21445, partial [Solirubrobacteraceae bacterium]